MLPLAILCFGGRLSAQESVSGAVVDAESGAAIEGAAVNVTGTRIWQVTDEAGRFTLRIPVDEIDGKELTVSFVGYKTLKAPLRAAGIYRLQEEKLALEEVVVTATEDHGLTATTRIGEDAISHIQPSSFADLLELLPGGRAVDPAFSSPQIVSLRSANAVSNSDYATSALGTRFLVDGKPVGNDANLQSTPAYSMLGSSYVNLGTDMRTLSTEDIESVDVVRGIASVEYGDLTSGLIRISRKKGGNDLRARFKADMKSKLFYAGKGFEWDRLTMNASVNFLDSRADPRNPRQNYKRLTGSYRIGKTWNASDRFMKVLNASLDYTGSFDDEKSDVNLDYGDFGPIETYRSTYHKLSLGGDFTLSSKRRETFFRAFSASASVTYEKDLIDRWKHVSLATETPLSTSLEPGEHDAISVPMRYDATLQVDGRPFYAYVNAVAKFRADRHNLKAGAEWNMDKNYGKGTLFDPARPFSTSMSVRPRPYDAIPATHQVSLFAEENASAAFGGVRFEWMLGLRAAAMAGAGSEYAVNWKPYLDPRLNLRLELPPQTLGEDNLSVGLFGGAGWHTKFPTMDMLYPEPLYGDLVQLNYWPVETDLRRIHLLVYKVDPTHYELLAARNFKWEIGLDGSWNGCSLSVDYFREDMTSGFRNGSRYMNVIYKDYDESAIDKSALTGPPALDHLPYQLDTFLTAYGITTNGSRTLKQGIEFSLTFKRIEALRTKITLNGAWFLTKYMNSAPEYYRPSVIINNKSYPYVGLYDKNDGSLYESFNTNVLFDTQIPRLGLIFSTSFQCQWFTGSQSMPDDKYPLSYIDKQLREHPFTEASAQDGVLGHLVRDYTQSLYVYQKIPFSMNINLKVMKKLYHDQASCSLFVNRLIDVTPDYYRNDVLVRRNVVPYFGMEIDFKL